MASPPPPLDALLETLRERPGQVARSPRAAIEAGLAQLRRIRASDARGTEGTRTVEYRIDDLARAAGMTTRNVRAYQDRGLLPPPRRSGRVALYNDAHVARLRLIGSMLERGYTTAHIAEMLTAWEHGKDLADVLGVEEELVRPRSTDQPTTMTRKQARALAGDAAAFDRLVDLGVVAVHGQQATVSRPKLLAGFAELRGHGMAMDTLLDLYADTLPPVDDVARRLVLAAAQHFATVKGPDWIPSAEELGELTEVLARWRTLATDSVMDTLAVSMERMIERVLGAYLGQLTDTPDSSRDAG